MEETAMQALSRAARRYCVGIMIAIPGSAALNSCAHPAPALHGRARLISGRTTAQLGVAQATRKVFAIAAAIALDHGYRYFTISHPIHPGTDVLVTVYAKGEIDPQASGVCDAAAVEAGQLPPSVPDRSLDRD
ncbi:MAG: hypothetical protein ACREHF_06030 [Rhizomicrobium sp.]